MALEIILAQVGAWRFEEKCLRACSLKPRMNARSRSASSGRIGRKWNSTPLTKRHERPRDGRAGASKSRCERGGAVAGVPEQLALNYLRDRHRYTQRLFTSYRPSTQKTKAAGRCRRLACTIAVRF